MNARCRVGNMTTTDFTSVTNEDATANCPTPTWVTVQDARGRQRLEMRWQIVSAHVEAHVEVARAA
ncbi:MAG: hypothetical protein ACRYF3_10405 [Janthinobacterium lividum]